MRLRAQAETFSAFEALRLVCVGSCMWPGRMPGVAVLVLVELRAGGGRLTFGGCGAWVDHAIRFVRVVWRGGGACWAVYCLLSSAPRLLLAVSILPRYACSCMGAVARLPSRFRPWMLRIFRQIYLLRQHTISTSRPLTLVITDCSRQLLSFKCCDPWVERRLVSLSIT